LLWLCGAADAQEYLYWPVVGHEGDVRGTYADYRPSGDYFHGGIDIHAPSGTHADGVADLLIVEQAVMLDQQKGYQVFVMDATTYEMYYYVHVQGYDSEGRSLSLGHTITHGQNSFLIYDLDQDNIADNDHLHLEISVPPPGQGRRNPLWANDNPYRELEGASDDTTPPTIEAVAFAEYNGPYNPENVLETFVELPTSELVYIWDGTKTDIIVWAHDDAGKVGVRGLSYAVLDPGQAVTESDWIPFCDFTQGLPDPADWSLVYAFQRDGGEDVLTMPNAPHDRMWYIVTNTSGTANSFADSAWRTPLLVGDQPELLKTVHIKAVDAAGNVATASIDVAITSRQGGEGPATFWVTDNGEELVARWMRNSGPPVQGYQISVRCSGGGAETLLSVSATEQGESGAEVYCVGIPGDRRSPECVYRLEAVMRDGSSIPLAWARAVSFVGNALDQ
jgi:hypothetical protein